MDSYNCTKLFPWQQDMWADLQQQRARLPHALLFCGQPGIGKMSFTKALACALLCEQPTQVGLGCGQCQSCRWFVAETHPDFCCIAPDVANQHISIATIREVIHYALQSRHHSSRKVIVIKDCDCLNLAGVNALLKILEEPPAGCHFILVTARQEYLIATLRSRCQQVVFHVPPHAMAMQWLSERGIEGDDVPLLLNLAQGAPLSVEDMAQDSDYLAKRKKVFQDWLFVRTQHRDPIEIAAKWVEYDTHTVLTWLYSWVGDLIRMQMDLSEACCQNVDMIESLLTLVQVSPIVLVMGIHDSLLTLIFRLRQNENLNKQLLWEEFLLEWAQGCAYGNKVGICSE